MDTHGAWVVGILTLWRITLKRKTKVGNDQGRAFFLCERKNQIIYCICPSAASQSCQRQRVSAIADGLYSSPQILKATWHISLPSSQNITTSKTDDDHRN